VWEAVSGLLKDPERLRAGLDAMLEQERAAWRGNPDKETELWAGKLAEAERMRGGYQEQAAKGYMTLEELGVALDNSRRPARPQSVNLRPCAAAKSIWTSWSEIGMPFWSPTPGWCRRSWTASPQRSATRCIRCSGSKSLLTRTGLWR
jgi:hypothetical protein